jgi:hypothetical protein
MIGKGRATSVHTPCAFLPFFVTFLEVEASLDYHITLLHGVRLITDTSFPALVLLESAGRDRDRACGFWELRYTGAWRHQLGSAFT